MNGGTIAFFPTMLLNCSFTCNAYVSALLRNACTSQHPHKDSICGMGHPLALSLRKKIPTAFAIGIFVNAD